MIAWKTPEVPHWRPEEVPRLIRVKRRVVATESYRFSRAEAERLVFVCHLIDNGRLVSAHLDGPRWGGARP